MINNKEDFQELVADVLKVKEHALVCNTKNRKRVEGLEKFDPELARLFKVNHQNIADFYDYLAKKTESK